MKQTIISLLIVCWAVWSTGCSSAARNNSEAPSGRPVAEIPGLQRVGDIPSSDYPQKLHCVDTDHCWLQQGRKLQRTSDGGKHWNLVNVVGQEEPIRQFSFTDQEHGWAIALSDLYKTEDGGNTWTKTATPFDRGGQINSVYALDGDKTIWLAGGLYRKQTPDELKFGVPNNARVDDKVIEEAIFRSDDGGRSWEPESLSPILIGRIVSIQYFDRNHGLALGERAVYSTNGAGTWKMPRFPADCVRKEYLGDSYEGQPVSVAMLDSEWWWLAYSDGRIVKSEDGGRSWCDLAPAGSVQFDESARQFFQSLHFVNRSTGWGLGRDRYLYRSSDGGRTWTRIPSDIRFDTVAFQGSDYGILVSSDGLFRISKLE